MVGQLATFDAHARPQFFQFSAPSANAKLFQRRLDQGRRFLASNFQSKQQRYSTGRPFRFHHCLPGLPDHGRRTAGHDRQGRRVPLAYS